MFGMVPTSWEKWGGENRAEGDELIEVAEKWHFQQR
jgi:hypothetical protein